MDRSGSCHAEASVGLPLAPEDAWDVVMDWERQSRWMLFTRVWSTENGGAGVGGGVAARTSVGGVGFTDDMVITHWDPPRACTVKHLGKIVRGTGTFTLEPTSTAPAHGTPTPGSTISAPTSGSTSSAGGGVGSTFTWAEDVVPPFGWVGVFVWPVVRPVFEMMMRVSLRRLIKEIQ
jgi:Polyketide cyclase / dehydrase and lipid transport